MCVCMCVCACMCMSCVCELCVCVCVHMCVVHTMKSVSAWGDPWEVVTSSDNWLKLILHHSCEY